MSVRRTARGGVVTLTLDRPEARNALTAEMIEQLRTALDDAEQSPESRAVVLRANGSAFSAGGDFAAFRALIASPRLPDAPDPIVAHNRAFGALLERLSMLSVPTIAVVEGPAIGGGVGLVAACDVAVARKDVTFWLPEATLGLPPAQVAPFVADRIGRAAALRLMLTGEKIGTAQAFALGLIERIADGRAELEVMLERTLDALGRAEPNAVRATKRILLLDRTATRAATLDFAAERFAEALASGRVSEGLAAFAERRDPAWSAQLGDGVIT